MTTVVEIHAAMAFESLQEGELPIRIARETVLKHVGDVYSYPTDVVSLTIGPYKPFHGNPEQMTAFANMLKQTSGHFRFGENLQHHAKLEFLRVTHDRSSALSFWNETPGAETDAEPVELKLTINEVLQLANCIQVTATMALPARGPRRSVQIDVPHSRVRLVRHPDNTVVIFLNDRERLQGSYEEACMLINGLVKLQRGLVDEMSVWFNGEEVRIGIDQTVREEENRFRVVLTKVSQNAMFYFSVGGAELLTDALREVVRRPAPL